VGSCSKRTNPSPNRPAQAGAAEHQPFASRYRRTHDLRGHRDLDLAERREGVPNCKTKRIPHQLASWDLSAVSAERRLVEAGLVGDKENPAVAGTLVGEG